MHEEELTIERERERERERCVVGGGVWEGGEGRERERHQNAIIQHPN